MEASPSAAGRTCCWVWPVRHRPSTGERVLRLASAARGLVTPRRWPFAAILAGTLPLAIGWALGVPGQQLASGILLFPLFLALVCDDRQGAAIGTIALGFGAHCALAIALSAFDPAGAAAVMPGGQDYWEKNLYWIRTGIDPEYQIANWVPFHALLAVGISLFSFTSLGLIPLYEGVHEVDLMNFYVGRLVMESRSTGVALLAGWHLWSILRGVAYSFLIYEVASWSLSRIAGRPLSTRRRHAWRLGIAIALLLADGGVKYAMLDAVRRVLWANLR